jgi:hypothetical protein
MIGPQVEFDGQSLRGRQISLLQESVKGALFQGICTNLPQQKYRQLTVRLLKLPFVYFLVSSIILCCLNGWKSSQVHENSRKHENTHFPNVEILIMPFETIQ